MSRSDKDKAGGHPRRDKPRSGLLDCLCCPHLVPEAWSPQRQVREADAMRREFMADDGTDIPSVYGEHQFLAGRCMRCRIRDLDALLPQYRQCPDSVEDEPIRYITATQGEVHTSHLIT